MRHLIKNSIFRFLIFIIGIPFLFNCEAIDQVTKPTAKSTSTGGPTIDEAQKEKYDGPKARIAVTKFLDKSAKGKATGEIGDGMAEMLAHALFATNRFIVLERQSLDEVIREQDLGASGRVSPETAARIGQIEGADLLVRGTITEFEPGTAGGEGKIERRSPGGCTIGSILGGIKVSHVALIVQLIDTRTARIVASEQCESKAYDISGMLGIIGGGDLAGVFSVFSKTPMEKAIRIAIECAVKMIVAKTPPEYYRYQQESQPKQPPIPPHEPPKSPEPPPPEPPLPSPPTPEPSVSKEPTQTPISRTAIIMYEPVNLREGPGPNYKTIVPLKKGTMVEILEDQGEWLRVRLENGTEGWLMKKQTSEAPKDEGKPSPPPPPPKGPM